MTFIDLHVYKAIKLYHMTFIDLHLYKAIKLYHMTFINLPVFQSPSDAVTMTVLLHIIHSEKENIMLLYYILCT